jgi:hypothetical protein
MMAPKSQPSAASLSTHFPHTAKRQQQRSLASQPQRALAAHLNLVSICRHLCCIAVVCIPHWCSHHCTFLGLPCLPAPTPSPVCPLYAEAASLPAELTDNALAGVVQHNCWGIEHSELGICGERGEQSHSFVGEGGLCACCMLGDMQHASGYNVTCMVCLYECRTVARVCDAEPQLRAQHHTCADW